MLQASRSLHQFSRIVLELSYEAVTDSLLIKPGDLTLLQPPLRALDGRNVRQRILCGWFDRFLLGERVFAWRDLNQRFSRHIQSETILLRIE